MQALLGGDEVYHYHSKLMMKAHRLIIHHFNPKKKYIRLLKALAMCDVKFFIFEKQMASSKVLIKVYIKLA